MKRKKITSFLKIFLVIALVFSAVFLAGATLAQSSSQGVIEGRVLNKTKKGTPVPNQQVILKKYLDQAEKGEEAGRTDSQGKFEFSNLPTGTKYSYFVVVNHQGAEYSSAPVIFKEGEKTAQTEVAVYAPTTETKGVRVSSHHIIIEVEKGNLSVQEVIVFAKDGDKAYIGEVGSSGKRETLKFYLSQGASDLILMQGFRENRVVPISQGFADTLPLPPGSDHSFGQKVFSYKIKPTSFPYLFSKELAYDTANIQVFVSSGGAKVKPRGLKAAGEMETQDNKKFLRFSGDNLKANAPLSLEISKAPTGKFSTSLQWIAAAVVIVLMMAGLSYPYLRRKQAEREEWEVDEARDKIDQAEEDQVLIKERRKLVSAIAQLDEGFESGKISEEEYKEVRSKKKERLIKITRKLSDLRQARP